jgi:hypothetical protein
MSRRNASSRGVPNFFKFVIYSATCEQPKPAWCLTTSEGILLSSAYSSLRRLTRSNSLPRTVIFAVSRCLDWSGLRSTFAMDVTGTPFSSRNETKCSAKVTPVMSAMATSMSLLSKPSSCRMSSECQRIMIRMPRLTLSRAQPPAILQDVKIPLSCFMCLAH